MISFTYKRIYEVLRARVALRRVMNEDVGGLLTCDHESAMRAVVESAFAMVGLALAPMVEDFEMDADNDILTLTVAKGVDEGKLRPYAEAALTTWGMHLLLSGVDEVESARSEASFRRLAEECRDMCGLDKVGEIKPVWY